uniref:Bardet-Biedl syndrome 9 n=1 Tax=Propithecus coquereli TaxID=379532 RepID=A0A2K6FN37_PROCO
RGYFSNSICMNNFMALKRPLNGSDVCLVNIDLLRQIFIPEHFSGYLRLIILLHLLHNLKIGKCMYTDINNLIALLVCNLKFKLPILSLGEEINYDIFVVDNDADIIFIKIVGHLISSNSSLGRDLICIQSMDGMLMVFEQESYAFGRFLPGSLLPGPLAYSSRTDSFITVSSCRQVESYKYQVLAFATDADKRQETEQQKLGSGKRLVVDWTLNIGEQALDICIVSFNQSASSVFVLGERNFFCLKDNGQIRFMKKLDCSPSCFLPYCSVSEGTTNTLIGNHNNMLHIYQDVTLKWATQLPHTPVAVRVGCFHDLKGVIVTLSDDGHLQCSYLGTDPSLFQAPKVESRELNYDELDTELKELQKIIKEVNKSQGISFVQAADVDVGTDLVPSITVKVTLQNRVVLQKAKLSIYVQPPLVLTCDQFTFEFMTPEMTRTVGFSVYLKKSYTPSELEGNAVVSYSRPTGIPRVIQCKFRLPLKLICLPGQPSKTASHKLTIDTNKSPVSLLSLFPGFANQSDDDQVNIMGFRFLGGSRVTLLASKTSQRYRIQSEQFEDLWLITNELILRLQEYFEKQGIKDFACSFSGSMPLQEYFELIDHHFELRINGEKLEELLSERAVQFRAIQRRLLTRFKDKTPAPLQHLDTLLEGTFKQVSLISVTNGICYYLFLLLDPHVSPVQGSLHGLVLCTVTQSSVFDLVFYSSRFDILSTF